MSIVSVNVYGINCDHEIFPLRIFKTILRNHYDILFITNTTVAKKRMINCRKKNKI